MVASRRYYERNPLGVRMKRPSLTGVLRAILFLFLLLSSAAILYATALNSRTAQTLAESSLESTALALSTSAEGCPAGGMEPGGRRDPECPKRSRRGLCDDREEGRDDPFPYEPGIGRHQDSRGGTGGMAAVGKDLRTEGHARYRPPCLRIQLPPPRPGRKGRDPASRPSCCPGGSHSLRCPQDVVDGGCRPFSFVGGRDCIGAGVDTPPSASGRGGPEGTPGPDRTDDLYARPRDPERLGEHQRVHPMGGREGRGGGPPEEGACDRSPGHGADRGARERSPRVFPGRELLC